MGTELDIEQELIEKGYTYHGQEEEWRKISQDSRVNIVGIGSGRLCQISGVQVHGGLAESSLYGLFLFGDGLVFRESNFYPVPSLNRSQISCFGSAANHFNWCELCFNREGSFAIGKSGTYGAFYNEQGALRTLNVNSDSGPFVSFVFSDNKIQDSGDKELGKLPEYLNTGQKLLFDELYFSIGQLSGETVVRIISPVKQIEFLRISVPTAVSFYNIREILFNPEGSDWVSLREHVPVKEELDILPMEKTLEVYKMMQMAKIRKLFSGVF